MAENRARHAFGSSSSIEAAKQANKIDAFDILFLDGNTDNPKIGWLDAQGNTVIVQDKNQIVRVDKLPTTDGDENVVYIYNNECYIWNGSQCVSTCKPADLSELESALDDVANASHTHEKIKYEITDVPEGTLVDYKDAEIRIMCPKSAVFTKQNVGTGGDANSYYCTFKTYVYDDNIVGYREHLGSQVDKEILRDLKTDEYGRRYQPSWLALAKYNESTDVWAYYGEGSSKEKFIGWDYQIDFYDANNVLVASDCIRINLSNEDCHSSIEPYYVGSMMSEIDEKIGAKIAEVNSAYEIVEF